jgi:hypothetical protein
MHNVQKDYVRKKKSSVSHLVVVESLRNKYDCFLPPLSLPLSHLILPGESAERARKHNAASRVSTHAHSPSAASGASSHAQRHRRPTERARTRSTAWASHGASYAAGAAWAYRSGEPARVSMPRPASMQRERALAAVIEHGGGRQARSVDEPSWRPASARRERALAAASVTAARPAA